jgi:thiamine pyrophosphate-dependent acetolactate synthase large subunit-like protein
LELQGKYLTKKIEADGRALFTQAKAIWAEQPNSAGAARIARLIPQISPQVSFIGDVHTFTSEVSAVVQAQELREWEQQVKEYNDRLAREQRDWEQEVKQYNDQLELKKMQTAREYRLEQQRISAIREVAVEYVKNQPKEIYNTLIIR